MHSSLPGRLKAGERWAREIGELAEDLQDIIAKGWFYEMVQARGRKGRQRAGWSTIELLYLEFAGKWTRCNWVSLNGNKHLVEASNRYNLLKVAVLRGSAT